MNIIIANSNPVHRDLEIRLKEKYGALIINSKEELDYGKIKALSPDYIFFPHWSFLIPADIYENFECVVFHMTDLPYGRGGSPLQNLIRRGFENTKVSALKVVETLDGGDIYMKKELSLLGTAEEIFLRLGAVVESMIAGIVAARPVPVAQTGEIVKFSRLKPADGNIAGLESLEQVFNYIRMLDAEGYPPAFLEAGSFRFDFGRASLKKDHIIADVRIFKK